MKKTIQLSMLILSSIMCLSSLKAIDKFEDKIIIKGIDKTTPLFSLTIGSGLIILPNPFLNLIGEIYYPNFLNSNFSIGGKLEYSLSSEVFGKNDYEASDELSELRKGDNPSYGTSGFMIGLSSSYHIFLWDKYSTFEWSGYDQGAYHFSKEFNGPSVTYFDIGLDLDYTRIFGSNFKKGQYTSGMKTMEYSYLATGYDLILNPKLIIGNYNNFIGNFLDNEKSFKSNSYLSVGFLASPNFNKTGWSLEINYGGTIQPQWLNFGFIYNTMKYKDLPADLVDGFKKKPEINFSSIFVKATF